MRRFASILASADGEDVSVMRQRARETKGARRRRRTPMQNRNYATLPFTSPASGCHAIKGSRTVAPEPKVLFRFGAGNKVGH